MSINIGYTKDFYNISNFNIDNNSLNLNNYSNSNIINLNIDELSNNDTVINYKNLYSTGISTSNYIIRNITSNEDLIIINGTSNEIFIYPETNIINNIKIKENQLYTDDDTVNISSNLKLNLLNDLDNFSINNNEGSNILSIMNNSNIDISLLHSSNNLNIFNNSNYSILELSSNNLNTTLDVNIKDNKTLFVNTIDKYDSEDLTILNAKFENFITDNTTINQFINIKNDISYINEEPNIANIYIEGYSSFSNIFEIKTSYASNVLPNNKFIIDKEGNVSIGNSNINNASLSITKINENIIDYKGETIGSVFNISSNGNVGIGTSIPEGLLNIVRLDDLTGSNIRKDPLINMNIVYDIENNYNITSNNITNTFNYTEIDIDDQITSNINIDTNSNLFTEEIHILPNILYADINSNILNLNNIIWSSNIINISKDIIIGANTNTINNKIYYPDISTFNIYTSNIDIEFSNDTIYNSNNIYILNSSTNIDNSYTEHNGSLTYNVINTYNSLQYVDSSSNIINSLSIFIEDAVLSTIEYTKINTELYETPDYIYMTSNDNFIASLSSYGTLSLGDKVPDISSNKYLLYAPSTSYISKIETNNIIPCTGNDIDISNNNIININNINSSNIINDNLYSKYIYQSSNINSKSSSNIIDDALTKIIPINGISYIDDIDGLSKTELSLSELEANLPESVITVDGIKYISYNSIIPYIIVSIKEINTRLIAVEPAGP